MCGIGGVWVFSDKSNRRLDKSDAQKLKKLAVLLESRGTDAFGFYNLDKLVKFPSRASQVIEQIEQLVPWESLVVGKRAFLMHTRLATRGDPLNNINNHPFETENFVLAHNGHIWTYDSYFISEKTVSVVKNNIPETDSYQIIEKIETEYSKDYDAFEATKRAIEKLYAYGDYALWIYSKTEHLLILYRDINPLHIAYENDKLWFASEKEMLSALGFENISSLAKGYMYAYDDKGFAKIDKINAETKTQKNNWLEYYYYNLYNDSNTKKKTKKLHKYDHKYEDDEKEDSEDVFNEVCTQYCDEYNTCRRYYESTGVRLCDLWKDS